MQRFSAVIYYFAASRAYCQQRTAWTVALPVKFRTGALDVQPAVADALVAGAGRERIAAGDGRTVSPDGLERAAVAGI